MIGGEGGVDVFLELRQIIGVVDAAEQRLTDCVSVPVEHIGRREGHDAEGERTGVARGIEIDIAVGRALGLQDLLCGGDGIGVAVERFGIDADHLAALLLRGLVQLVQLAQLSDTGLAAAEPEVHDRVGVVREQAAVDRIPVEILACKLRKRTGRGRFALAGAVVGGQGRDLRVKRAQREFPSFTGKRLTKLPAMGYTLDRKDQTALTRDFLSVRAAKFGMRFAYRLKQQTSTENLCMTPGNGCRYR